MENTSMHPSQDMIQGDRSDRTVPMSMSIAVILYLALVIIAEIMIASNRTLTGAFIHGMLLLVLVNLYPSSKSIEIRKLILALVLVPLLRILSLAMPIPQVEPIFWYVMVGFPLLLATMWVVRTNGLPSLTIRIPMGELIIQILFGFLGIPLGLLASFLFDPPAAVISNPTLFWIVTAGLVLIILSAFVEEIIFRGIVQNALSFTFGSIAFLVSSIIYASMFLGTLSPGMVIFYGLTGLLFSFWVQARGSLWGVIIAHSLMNITFLLLVPLIGL